MRETILMYSSKQTFGALRWEADVEGTRFNLYVPKWRVPAPWPAQIIVTVDTNLYIPQNIPGQSQDPSQEIAVIVELKETHGQTVQYWPVGENFHEWEIGRPFIPHKILNDISPARYPQKLRIVVEWDYSGGNWANKSGFKGGLQWLPEEDEDEKKHPPFLSFEGKIEPHSGIYKRLKEIARQGGLIAYSEIAPMAELKMESQADRIKLGEILGDISRLEHDQGRPMLSAIVVHTEDQMPGRGFFNLARELGLLHGNDDLTELEFFAREVKKVHRYWSEK